MKLRLTNYPDHQGVKTEIDGHELPEVTDIKLTCPVDGLPMLTVTMLATDINVEIVDVHVKAKTLVRCRRCLGAGCATLKHGNKKPCARCKGRGVHTRRSTGR